MAETIFTIYTLIDGIFTTSRDLITHWKTPEDVTKDTPPLRIKIAPDFHDTEGEANLDDYTKIMVSVVNKVLTNELREKSEKFFDVVGIFKGGNAGVVAVQKGEPVQASKMFVAEDKGWFKDETEAKEAVIKQTLEWLAKDVIVNPKVLHATGLDDKSVLSGLVTFAKGTTDLLSLIYHETEENKELLDIGIIQYPTTKDEVFRLSNIKLFAWIKQTKIAGGSYETSEVGIRAEYLSYDFEPRKENIGSFKEETKEKALASYYAFAQELPVKLAESKKKQEEKTGV